MPEPTIEELKQRFEARLRATIPLCARFGYYPGDFISMLNNCGDVLDLVRKLVLTGDLQSGLKRLHKEDHLNLSLERLMLEPEFRRLFDDGLRTSAQFRLRLLDLEAQE